MYRIFNVAINSKLALPELSELEPPPGMPVYSFALASEEEIAGPSAGIDWFHDWQDRDGNVTIRGGRDKNCHWLRFPQLTDFAIDLADRRITAFPVSATEQTTLRHLLLDQVIPRVLGQEGTLVLHAGAAQLSNGKTVAFVGETGHGKSTLVSSFERSGARLITDDCLMVVPDQTVARVIPNYAGVRLFDDSINAIYGTGRAVADVAQYTSKRRVTMPAGDLMLEFEDTTLDALFVLGDPEEYKSDEVDLQPATGTHAFMKLVEQSFLLDVTDRELTAKLFREAGTLLGGKMRCYALNYPRDHKRLGELRMAIEQVVE